MPEIAADAIGSAPLGQVERVVDTFIAPSKTFHDILRDSTWWLPWLLGVVVTLAFGVVIQQKIGWDKTYNTILLQSSQSQQDRMSQLPADQQAKQKAVGAAFVKYVFWGTPVLGLLFAAIAAGVLQLTLKYALGGHPTFPRMFAVWMYGSLPYTIQGILSIVAILAGLDADSFNLKNPVGTNPGYYLPLDSAKWLLALAGSFDILTIWVLVLLTLGCATVAGVKKSTAAIAVWGWWMVIVVAKVITA